MLSLCLMVFGGFESPSRISCSQFRPGLHWLRSQVTPPGLGFRRPGPPNGNLPAGGIRSMKKQLQDLATTKIGAKMPWWCLNCW